jgi:nucleoid-associated protein YgaU
VLAGRHGRKDQAAAGRDPRAGGREAAKKEADMGFLDGIFNRDKDKKQGRPDFSSVQSGGSSTAPSPATTDPTDGSRAGRTYTGVQGDSLSKIAKHQYGDANKWRTIYEANRDLIKNPDLIYPGQSFKIPEA